MKNHINAIAGTQEYGPFVLYTQDRLRLTGEWGNQTTLTEDQDNSCFFIEGPEP